MRSFVEMPHFWVWLLSSVSNLFSSDVINPFGYDWRCFEMIGMYALLARMRLKLELGRETVALRELRPGALASEETLDLQVHLPNVLRTGGIPILTDQLSSGLQYPYRTGTGGQGAPLALYESGGVVETCVGQPAIDGITCFPASADGPGRLVLASQYKSLMKLNPRTGKPSSSRLQKGAAVQVLSKMGQVLQEELRHLELQEEQRSVCELFSNLPSKLQARDIPGNCMVVTQAQWKKAVGPVFAQRARLLPPASNVM
jgi:hypothetical protein